MEAKTEAKPLPSSTQLAARPPMPFVPTNLEEAWRMAEMFSKASIVPDALRGKPYDLLITLMAGAEFGLSPAAALREVYVVKGKAMMSSLLKSALVKQSADCEFFRLVESTPERATFETKRRGEGLTKMSFTIQEATLAGLLGNENWKKYPALMLRRRCSSQLADEVYPEVTRGAGLIDDVEQGAFNPLPRSEAPPMTVVSIKQNPPPATADDLGLADPPPTPPVQTSGQPTADRGPVHVDSPAEALPSSGAALEQPVEREPGADDVEPQDEADRLLAALAKAKTEADLDPLALRAKAYVGPRRGELVEAFKAKRKALRG